MILVVCVCVCVFIKLHITAQSGPVILAVAFSEYVSYHFRFRFVWTIEHVVRYFLPNGVFFPPCNHGLDFLISLLYENSINQIINVGEKPTVMLYAYINRHAGTPNKKEKQTRNNVVHHQIATHTTTKNRRFGRGPDRRYPLDELKVHQVYVRAFLCSRKNALFNPPPDCGSLLGFLAWVGLSSACARRCLCSDPL